MDGVFHTRGWERAVWWCPKVEARKQLGAFSRVFGNFPLDTKYNNQPSRNGIPDMCEQQR